ncbi:MAG: Protein hit [Phycisphaerae bacterium]|nr:Protein hit [Phycisphaerae bacterium]
MSPSDPQCVFCRIAAGGIPCHKVLDQAGVLAFLDIAPIAAGHTVVIPRRHAARLDELEADALRELAGVLGPLAKRVCREVGAPAYNILQNNGLPAGQVVMHVHFHIIPRRDGDGLGFRWPAGSPAPAELAALAERIRAAG